MQHDLKTYPEYFDAVADGSKPFELRYDDRGYRVGDTLLLRRYDPLSGGYTGETMERRVTYVLRGGLWLTPGYVALGLGVAE